MSDHVTEGGPEPDPEPDQWFGVVLAQRKSSADDSTPKTTFLDKSAKALAGGYAVVTVLLTTIGTLQGGLGRLLLNQPVLSLLGFGLSFVGIGLAFFAAYGIHDDPETATMKVNHSHWKAITVVIALMFFLGGIGVLVYAEEDTLSQNERPTIALKATLGAEGSILEGEVTANGVKSSEWIYVSINGAQELDTGVEGSTLLYKTRAGPDANGKVDIKFTLPVVRLFDFIRIGATRANGSEDEVVDPCFPSPGKGAEDQSCATFYPPHGPSRPTLTATLTKGAAGANLLNATIKTSGLDPDDVVLVDVSNAKTGGIFYRSMFSGSSAGAVDAEAKVSIPTGKTVCVVASTIKSTDTAAQQVQPKTRTCRIDSFDLSQSSFVFIAAPSAT